MISLLALGLLLALKHFLCDGPLQFQFQYMNKGKLFHIGGVSHATTHAAGTAIALLLSGAVIGQTALMAALIAADFVAHYFIDYAKTNLTKKEWAEYIGPAQMVDLVQVDPRYIKSHLAIYSDWYFYALVLDQSLHFATYAVIMWVVA